MFAIKACLVHKKKSKPNNPTKKPCWRRRMFCFTELSVFISALIQMRQANLIQMEIHFLAVMVHRTEKFIKTRKKKGEKETNSQHVGHISQAPSC